MNRSFRRVVFLLLHTIVASAAAAPSGLGQSTPEAVDPSALMPIADVEPFVTSDTPNGVPTQSQPEIGPLAQAFGGSRNTSDNFPPAPSRNDAETPTLTAIKALSEQVKSLESRIAAQDARIAML